jgi:hypothetical protein
VSRDRLLLVVRGTMVVVVLAAMAAQAAVLVDAGAFDATRFFAFFTIQSNLVGVAAFLWLVGTRGTPHGRRTDLLRGAAVVYLTVTFIVVIALLGGVDVQLQLPWAEFVLHKLFPLVMVADWIVDPPATRLALRDSRVWLVYPIAWTVLTVIRGALDGWYPYPFLDPANGGYGHVALMVFVITGAFLVIAVLTIMVGKARWQAGRSQ